jgi:Flp pilus assembly protein TadG
MRKPRFGSRSGVAAVEFAVVLPVLLLLLAGVWVVGRMIQVHQMMDWAAREGARTASQGQIINLDDDYQQIKVVDSPGKLSVKSVVEEYLSSNGINTTGLDVQYENLTSGLAEPYEAVKGDQLSLTVLLPHDNVRYPVFTQLPGWALPNPNFLTTTLEFYSLQDDPFTVNDTLPNWEGL